ncbi:hypothetical protein M9H77_31010 [Catharanthus roseus]|uniref:Uncharacterized protein n=1 Tax=Catharanthus roseus TaxID=4058 RepID=A0ACC0A177_CATRO|nr:hypothetical protein M9H77_31010 [Catharanthus roseus]
MNYDEEMRYLWTIPLHHTKEGIHILVEFEQMQQHSFPITQDINTTNMTEHIKAVTDDDDNNPEEGELQTLVNPVNPVNLVTENIVPQLESSQWFNSARYDYTHSRAFLDMGSGSPTDVLVESGTIRLLDWNDSMTNIHLGMRFVDKVQAISAVLCRKNESIADTYVPEIYSRQTYRRTYQANFHPVLSENFWRDVPFSLTFYPPNMKKEQGRK